MPYKPKQHRPPGRRTEQERRRDFDRNRKDKAHHAFYSSPAWRALRAAFLAANPLCAACLAQGRTVAAKVADHQQETKDRPDLALDETNLVALCVSCHNAKTTRTRLAKMTGVKMA